MKALQINILQGFFVFVELQPAASSKQPPTCADDSASLLTFTVARQQAP